MLCTAIVALNLVAADRQSPPIQLTSQVWSPIVKLSRGRPPMRVALSTERPPSVTKLPATTGTAHFGKLMVGQRTGGAREHVLLVDLGKTEAKMRFDTNANGDLTDDPDVEGKINRFEDGGWGIFGYAPVFVKYERGMKSGFMGLSLYVPAKEQPLKEMAAMTLFGFEGTMVVGDEEFAYSMEPIGVAGDFSGWENGKGFSLNIDRNGNKKVDSRGETFAADRPFTIGGVSYEAKRMEPDGTVEFGLSEKSVPEVAPSPNLSRGMIAPDFEAKTFEGKAVRLRDSFKGKVVLLDFWATWCGPCVAEIPSIKKTYESLRSKGLEIVSVNADDLKNSGKVKELLAKENMSWTHIPDNGQSGPVATLYGVQAWPTYVLVDGDTGLILLDNEAIRPNLTRGIELAMRRKFGR